MLPQIKISPSHAFRQSIYTDAHLCERNINQFLLHVDNLIGDDYLQLPCEWELVLGLSKEKKTEKRIWLYYFVHHTSKALFWLHKFKADKIKSGSQVLNPRPISVTIFGL